MGNGIRKLQTKDACCAIERFESNLVTPERRIGDLLGGQIIKRYMAEFTVVTAFGKYFKCCAADTTRRSVRLKAPPTPAAAPPSVHVHDQVSEFARQFQHPLACVMEES